MMTPTERSIELVSHLRAGIERAEAMPPGEARELALTFARHAEWYMLFMLAASPCMRELDGIALDFKVIDDRRAELRAAEIEKAHAWAKEAA